MEPQQDFKSVQEGVQKSLVSTVKTINRIAAEDLGFQRTVNPEVGGQLDEKSPRILDIANRLLHSSAKACGVKPPKLEDAEDIDMKWRSVVDVVDSVLEKADTALDEYTGLVKRKEPPTADPTVKTKRPKSTNKVIRNANIMKPQTQFDRKPDNFPKSPWKPILTTKPHAKLPLDQSLIVVPNEKGAPQYKHPYETEISEMEYPDSLYHTAEPILYQPVEKTAATWVDTYEGVLEMLEELKKAKEIAVDLEHHDYRTYVGLVCLMQVSTREKDWIVDTLQPWRHKLEVLNEVFADPNIVKVFHGAYMDMIWLQRDLGLYVNGLFDTYFACDLMYSGRSLAFLLSKFVDFDADKQYQLADWRMRPIPEEMMYYARSDTHYLLYIFDRVRNDLVSASDPSSPEKNYIEIALQRSRELSLSRREHPEFNAETGDGSRGWYNFVFKHPHLAFDSEQFAVFRAIWKWRDDTARREDESPQYLLSTNTITEIARINPPDAKALHSLLPLSAALARPRFGEMWALIKETKAGSGPSLLHFFTSLAPDALPLQGFARVSKNTTKLPDLDGEVTVNRLTRSQLFGDMPLSSRWEESKQLSDKQDDYIPFPWQRFVQEAAHEDGLQYGQASDGEPATATPAKQSVGPEASGPDGEPAEDLDQEFTLKRGQKRKSQVVDEDSSSSSSGEEEDEEGEDEAEDNEDEEMMDDSGIIAIEEEPKRPLSKKERKRQRKEQAKQEDEEKAKRQEAKKARKAKAREKKEKKAKQREEQGKKEKKYEAVPFDYSKAASVMHASRNTAGPAQDAGKKAFDPYSKTGDNPMKGARKAPPVRGERSATFKK